MSEQTHCQGESQSDLGGRYIRCSEGEPCKDMSQNVHEMYRYIYIDPDFTIWLEKGIKLDRKCWPRALNVPHSRVLPALRRRYAIRHEGPTRDCRL